MTNQKLGPNQQKWIDALRSGKYEQTEGSLYAQSENGESWGYCCLGVAQELFNPEEVDLDDRPYLGNGTHGDCSPQTQSDLGLFYQDGGAELPAISKRGDLVALSLMNDTGKTFKKIANHLEVNAEYYFKEVK